VQPSLQWIVLHIPSVVILVTQHAMRMNHIVICGLNIFPHYLINGTIFEKSFLNINAF